MKRTILLPLFILAICSCANKDAQMVKKYLEENDDLFAHPKVEVFSCENLGMQYSPFDELMSIYLTKSQVLQNGTQKLTDAVQISNRANRRKAIQEVIDMLQEEYDNPRLGDVANAISLPERSATLYPDKVNHVAIKASYAVEGRKGEEIFYLAPDGKSVNGRAATSQEAYENAAELNNRIFRLINEAKEWMKY